MIVANRRWMILAYLMALCFISHFNRASITSAGDERIMRQFRISPEHMGVIYSAFLIVYTLFMIAGGSVADGIVKRPTSPRSSAGGGELVPSSATLPGKRADHRGLDPRLRGG